MALVRTDPTQRRSGGISVLLIPLDATGIERRPIRQMDGGAEFAEIVFDEVFVPSSGLLGPLHDGWRVTMMTLAHERAAVISQTAVLARDVSNELDRWRSTTDGVLRQELMRRYTESRVLSWMGSRALARLKPGEVPQAEHSLIRFAQSGLRQRLAITRAQASGVGVIAGQDPAACQELLSSRSVSIAAGTTEVLKTILAERVLGLPATRCRASPSTERRPSDGYLP
jgi:alkylation response protein AidB-like acyl-CoA dehydrogenase